jgi:Mrp family chromosome partitioning ATPase
MDLSPAGAPSRAMLDTPSHPGITDLLAAEAQFADIIRADHYSDCHVIPIGTADPIRAMRGADRLPIILESLTTAYDLVVVEGGAGDATAVKRLSGDRSVVVVSAVEPESPEVTDAMADLAKHGFDPILVAAGADVLEGIDRAAA